AWAKSMTWKGSHPVVKLSRRLYQKGVSLSRKTMRERSKPDGSATPFAQMGHSDSAYLMGMFTFGNRLSS
ncbi:hypothetical protein, partial [Nitrosomonas communis]